MSASSRYGLGAPSRGALSIAFLIVLVSSPVTADDRSEVTRMRAERAASAGRCDEALPLLTRVIEANPRDARAQEVAGQCALQQKDYGAALDFFDAAAEVDPDLPDLDLYRGIALFHLGDPKKAENALDAARAKGVGDPAQLDLYTGLVLLQGARTREAALALERARRSGPDRVDPMASYYAGLAWQSADDVDRGRELLEGVIEEHPGTPWAEEARRRLDSSGARPRDLWVTVRTGIEYDSNVILEGDKVNGDSSNFKGSDQDDFLALWALEAGKELFRTDKWSGGLVAGYWGNAHFQRSSFDTHYPNATAWIDRELSHEARATLRYDTGYAWVDYEEYLYDHQVTLSLLKDWRQAGETELSVAGEYDNYLFDLDRVFDPVLHELDRDGFGVSTSLFHYLSVRDDLRLRAGYGFRNYWADGTEWDSMAHTVTLGGDAELPFGFEWDVEGSFTYEPFDNPSVYPQANIANPLPLTTDRLDKTWTVSTTIARPITESLILSASYGYTTVDSENDVYDYDRHRGGLYLTYQFQ